LGYCSDTFAARRLSPQFAVGGSLFIGCRFWRNQWVFLAEIAVNTCQNP
jgi:hypothetical protein